MRRLTAFALSLAIAAPLAMAAPLALLYASDAHADVRIPPKNRRAKPRRPPGDGTFRLQVARFGVTRVRISSGALPRRPVPTLRKLGDAPLRAPGVLRYAGISLGVLLMCLAVALWARRRPSLQRLLPPAALLVLLVAGGVLISQHVQANRAPARRAITRHAKRATGTFRFVATPPRDYVRIALPQRALQSACRALRVIP